MLTDIDLTRAVEFHKKKKAIATIVLTRVENPLAFGIVITDKSGRIIRFLEKPSWGEVFSDTINTGIYILDSKVLEFMPEGREFDFSNDLFPLLLEKKKPIYGYIAEGYWKDVGSLQEYRQANMDVLSGKVSVLVPGQKAGESGVYLGEGAKVDFTAELTGSVVLGAGCRVDGKASIANSVIGDNAVIEEGVTIRDSVAWDGLQVGRASSLNENIVGNSVTILDDAHIGEGAILSDNCKIGRRSAVKANVKVWPHKEVDDDATLASSLIWADKWSKTLFSPYGVTGLANIELSPEFAAKLGAAYGASLGKGAVISTSRDAHKTSRMLNRAIMTGVLSTGVNVNDYGVTPMPVVRFLARGESEVGGVHTRRSPFDIEMVDLKFFDTTGLDLHPGQEKSIEKLFFREDFRRVSMADSGELTFPPHAFDTYQTGFFSSIDIEVVQKANFKIVLDYSYGSSSRIFPALLGKLNCDVVALDAIIDGMKITKSAGEFAGSLERLSTIVRSLNADIGFLLDAGGEKVFIVDDSGDIMDGETALNLLSLLVLKTAKLEKTKGTIAVPVTASRAVEHMAKAYGCRVFRTKTTPRGLMEAAADKKTLFVGESTGGFIFPRFQPVFDGMYAIAKILEMLARVGTSMHKLVREIPPSIMLKKRISCSWEHKGMVMRRLAEDSRGKKTALIDGIKISYGDDWVIAYPSQSHSYFYVMAEATTEERATELITTYADKIITWQKEEATA